MANHLASVPSLRSRHSTKRSKAVPLGDLSARSVQIGNLMVTRCAIIIFIAAARAMFWVLEQPQNSLLEFHPMMQKVFSILKVFRYSMRMGDFGSPTAKPTWLYTCLSSFASASLWIFGSQEIAITVQVECKILFPFLTLVFG